MSKAPTIEVITVPGPAGEIEARLEMPSQDAGEAIAVICHPHPQYGGTMDNKVVHTVAAGFRDCGIPSVRFNFRGVGRSDGAFDGGRGEMQDLGAVLRYVAERLPSRDLWLGGFSFGSAIAARMAQSVPNSGLVLIAPPVTMAYFDDVSLSPASLVVHGDQDDLIPLAAVSAWLQDRERETTLQPVAGADHFFHGQLRILRNLVVTHLKERPAFAPVRSG